MVNAPNKKKIYRTGHCPSEYLNLRDILALGKPVLQHEEDIEDHPKTESPVTERGLCMNCGEKHLCRYPSFGKNVIHCESYV